MTSGSSETTIYAVYSANFLLMNPLSTSVHSGCTQSLGNTSFPMRITEPQWPSYVDFSVITALNRENGQLNGRNRLGTNPTMFEPRYHELGWIHCMNETNSSSCGVNTSRTCYKRSTDRNYSASEPSARAA